MIGFVIGLILVCIILGFLFWAFQQLMPLVLVAEPFRTILRILVAFLILVIVIWVLVQMLNFAGINVPMWGGRYSLNHHSWFLDPSNVALLAG